MRSTQNDAGSDASTNLKKNKPTAPSNDALEFQDSEVASAELEDKHFVVKFSAGRVCRAKGEQGADHKSGYFQALVLTIHDASILESESGCVGRVTQGELRVAGATSRLVPIPYEAIVNVELELVFANGSNCRVAGHGVTLKPTGEARMMEWLKC